MVKVTSICSEGHLYNSGQLLVGFTSSRDTFCFTIENQQTNKELPTILFKECSTQEKVKERNHQITTALNDLKCTAGFL